MSDATNPTDSSNPRVHKRKLATILTVAFAIAMVMGPGPGIYLVNPVVTAPEPRTLLWGIPILYLWAVFWCAVETAIVLTAYLLLWDTRRGQQ